VNKPQQGLRQETKKLKFNEKQVHIKLIQVTET